MDESTDCPLCEGAVVGAEHVFFTSQGEISNQISTKSRLTVKNLLSDVVVVTVKRMYQRLRESEAEHWHRSEDTGIKTT